MYYETTKELLAFIKKSPTAFHAVEEMQARLTEDGFQVLSEKEHWKLTPGGKYVVTRNHSALIALPYRRRNHGSFISSPATAIHRLLRSKKTRRSL